MLCCLMALHACTWEGPFTEALDQSQRRSTVILVRASVTFPGLPLRSSDVVRARSAKLDCLPKYCLCGSSLRTSQTGSPNTSHLCHINQRAPRSLCALCLSVTEAYGCKSCRRHENRAYQHLSNSMQELVITPRRLSLFQYVVAA